MKRNLQMLAVPAAITASFLIGCSAPLRIIERTDPTRPSVVQTQEGYDTFGRKWEVLSRNESMVLSYTSTITDIDYPNRELSLRDPQGRMETFVVDEKVKRFNEARIGDKVFLDYYLGVNAVVRIPTAEERQNPLIVLESSAGQAGPVAAPAAYDTRRVRAVVTIEAMDKSAQTVTVKGPRGKHFVARVADPSRLEKVRIGETILMTFTEAAVVSLKPAGN